MAKTYADYMAQIEAIRKKAEATRLKEVTGVIARIRAAVEHYALTPEDIFGREKRGATDKSVKTRSPGGKRPSGASQEKYRDQNGNTWGGRGPRPRWLREALASGKALEDFAVEQGAGRHGRREVADVAVAAAEHRTKKARALSGRSGRGNAGAKQTQRSKLEEGAQTARAG